MNSFDVSGRRIGSGQPCFVIAEVGVNHNGSVDLARQLIDAAKAAGADAVKFQTFAADRLASADAAKAAYQQETTGAGESQRDMLRQLELPLSAHRQLMEYADRAGLLFLSTPFDEVSATELAALGVAAFKIGSGDLTNLPLLQHVAKFGRPLIISTGMATLAEVEQAVAAVREAGNPPLCLLQCVSNYPAAPEHVNLRAMETMRQAFAVPVGYSDHTIGTEASLAAVALGAAVLEKHLTLDRQMPGPDHRASSEPAELRQLVQSLRIVESTLGNGIKVPALSEADTAAVARKSLYFAANLAAGQVIRREHIALLRPGTGLSPARLQEIIGKRVRRAVKDGQAVTLTDLE